jgi:hypothetical protein
MIEGGDLTIAYSRLQIAKPVLKPAAQPHLAKILKIIASLAAAVVVIGGLLGYWNAWNTDKPEITNHREATIPSLDWKRVRAVAERKSIPLPDELTFTTDVKKVPMPFRP